MACSLWSLRIAGPILPEVWGKTRNEIYPIFKVDAALVSEVGMDQKPMIHHISKIEGSQSFWCLHAHDFNSNIPKQLETTYPLVVKHGRLENPL